MGHRTHPRTRTYLRTTRDCLQTSNGETTTVKRGDIVLVDLEPVKGSETGKIRPCVIIQNDIGNKFSSTTIVAIVTSQKEISKEYPTDVWVEKNKGGLNLDSIIQGDQIRTISKERIVKKLEHFEDGVMNKANKALKISLGL